MKQLNVIVPKEVDKQLEKYCAVHDMKKKDAVEKAIMLLVTAKNA